MARLRMSAVMAVILSLAGAVVGVATYSAFHGTAANAGNLVEAGTVHIADNDSGSGLVSLSDARPGQSSSGCIVVTYEGTLDAQVRLYAATSGGLGGYLTLTVTRGSDPSQDFSCTSFTPDASDYIGGGAGVIYDGDLDAFPTSWADGIEDAPGSREAWSQSEAHSYKFTVALQDVPGAQGLAGDASFTWEARNL